MCSKLCRRLKKRVRDTYPKIIKSIHINVHIMHNNYLTYLVGGFDGLSSQAGQDSPGACSKEDVCMGKSLSFNMYDLTPAGKAQDINIAMCNTSNSQVVFVSLSNVSSSELSSLSRSSAEMGSLSIKVDHIIILVGLTN